MACSNGTKEGAAWEDQRGPRVAELLARRGREYCDLYIVAGEPPERIPASRLLLAAASRPLAKQLQLDEFPSGAELFLPTVSAAAARAIVAYSCGAPRPFEHCPAADVRAATAVLKDGLLEPEDIQSSSRVKRHADFSRAGDGINDDFEATTSFKATSRAQRGWRCRALFGGIAWLCFVGGSLAAYYPTASFNMELGGFFMDDAMIRRNLVVVDEVMDWRRLWQTDYWGLEMFDPQTWTHKSFRPLVVLTFRWNYLLHGFNSSGFHLTNFAMHASATAQLGLFGRQALRLPWAWAALLAALFAVHPVHTENICYVVGRADIMCTQVLLLAGHVYLPCSSASSGSAIGTWVRLLIAALLVVVSGLCKETGFTFFGLLVIWEVLGITRCVKLCKSFGRALRVLVLLVVGGLACFARVSYTAGTQIARMDPYSNPVAASPDPSVRFWSYLLVHGMYMKLLVWPSFLCYDYSMDAVPLVESASDVRLLLPCAAYLAFLQLSCQAVRRLRVRSPSRRLVAEGPVLGVAIFVLSFLPMTNLLFPIGTLVAERLLYIPSLGFLVSVVSMAHLEFGGRHALSTWRRRARWGGIVTALFLALVAWWPLCYRRVLDWRTVEQITVVDGLKQLRSSRTQFNLANLYLTSQRLDEALVAYQRAIATDPQERDSMPLYHAGQILLYRGQYVEAEQYLHKAVSGYFSPLVLHEEEVWHDYGLALWHTGKAQEAAHNLQNALITNPAFPKGYNNLACALVLMGLSMQPPVSHIVQQGLQAMEQAVTMTPGAPLYWRNAAVVLSLAGDAQGSLRAWDHYRQLDPNSAAAVEATGVFPQDCIWEFYFR